MKNHCTFETSKAIRAAGFPQPTPEAGQVWYNNNKPFVICSVKNEIIFGVYFDNGTDGIFATTKQFEELIFAPGPADLLRELGTHYTLCFGDDLKWWATEHIYSPSEKEFIHENPAEACAAAWLELNKTIAPTEKK